jgi:hypothetical protein
MTDLRQFLVTDGVNAVTVSASSSHTAKFAAHAKMIAEGMLLPDDAVILTVVCEVEPHEVEQCLAALQGGSR